MKKFVNLEKSEDFQLLESVSINGIYQDIKNNSDIIKPIATTTIGAGCQNPYFIVNNLFSELQTYELKKKALENLLVPDIVKDFIQDIREPILNWSESFDLNDIIDSGVYTITGIRESNERDHLPINNFGNNTSISAKLFVTVSPEGNTTYRSIIGLTLFLSNAEGHETKIYTRSANKTSYDGSISYEVTWGDWQVCQGMKEVGVVDSYDSFIDNGMYSGVYNNNGITETFVIITINDYAVKSQLGDTKSVSQFKYSLNINNTIGLSTRVGAGEPLKWSNWESIFDKINSKQDKLTLFSEFVDADNNPTAAFMGVQTKDEKGGATTAAHVVEATRTGMYYSERKNDEVVHEDNIYIEKSNENGTGCLTLRSYDNSEGTPKDSVIQLTPDKIKMGSGGNVIDNVVQAIQDNTNAVNTLNGTGNGSVSKTVTDEIAKVVANAPSDFDTLKEIADYIASDKINAAEINNTLDALKTRVYELGDFATAKNAEDKAREPLYSGNEGISIIHYSVNGSTEGLILQHQDIEGGYHCSVQTLLYHSRMYVRFVWFTDSTRTVLLESANFNRDWWETSISHLEYDKTTHTIKCRRIGQDVNSTKWITLPSASTSTDGLMTMAQVKSLEGKQDQLANYVEIPRGKTTIKYPNGTARVEVNNVRAALWANDDKVAIAADANGTRMLYTKTAEDGYIEHRDEISIGRHDENSATHITLTSKSTTEDTGEKITNTSTIQVNPDGIAMSSPSGEIDDVVKEIAAHQNDGIELLANGNLKLTLKGETREFMPATPSGDPMHWAYVSAGAEYNDSGVDIVKTGVFGDTITHKAGHWYLNEIGDLTNEDMRIIFRYAEFLEYYETGDKLSTIKIRTFVPSDRPYTIRGSSFRAMQYIETIKIASMYSYAQAANNKIDYAFYNGMKNLRKIINVIYCYDKTVFGNTCFGLPKLEDIAIKKLPSSISFELCPNLSKESVKYMISNATPTSAITITLHADAYARLAEDADIVAALEAKPLVTLVSA